jgi:hypothetical protein
LDRSRRRRWARSEEIQRNERRRSLPWRTAGWDAPPTKRVAADEEGAVAVDLVAEEDA